MTLPPNGEGAGASSEAEMCRRGGETPSTAALTPSHPALSPQGGEGFSWPTFS